MYSPLIMKRLLNYWPEACTGFLALTLFMILLSGCGGAVGRTVSATDAQSQGTLTIINRNPFYETALASTIGVLPNDILSMMDTSNTQLLVTVSAIEACETENGTFQSILDGTVTFDLLSAKVQAEGQKITINSPKAGAYNYVKMQITGLKVVKDDVIYILEVPSVLQPAVFSYNGKFKSRDTSSGGIAWMVPFTVSGKATLLMTFFLPPDSVKQASASTFVITSAPSFSLRPVDQSNVASTAGTVSGTITLTGPSSAAVHVGVYETGHADFTGTTAPVPIFGTRATVSGATATYSLPLPANDFVLIAFEDVNGNAQAGGPDTGDRIYGKGTLASPTKATITAGQTTTYDMTFLRTWP